MRNVRLKKTCDENIEWHSEIHRFNRKRDADHLSKPMIENCRHCSWGRTDQLLLPGNHLGFAAIKPCIKREFDTRLEQRLQKRQTILVRHFHTIYKSKLCCGSACGPYRTEHVSEHGRRDYVLVVGKNHQCF